MVNKRRGRHGDSLLITDFVCRCILLNFCEAEKQLLRRTKECHVPKKGPFVMKTDIPWKEGMTKGQVK